MNPTSEELETYFQTEKEQQLFQELGSAEHDKIMADIRIEDLESAIRKFLHHCRMGEINKGWIVPFCQMEELATVLNNYAPE